MLKKLLAVSAAAITVISAMSLTYRTYAAQLQRAGAEASDLDGDGRVTYGDLGLLLGHIKAVSALKDQALSRTDINADGIIDIRDCNLIYNHVYIHSLESKLLAFPGAVGGGCLATGGRGGEVVHVTNLNDSGEGSFREAVSHSNRIVVFDVGGTIELKSAVVVSNNITIAGQTAPGGAGIVLKNYKIGFGGNNIICRFIASRPGKSGGSSGDDAVGGAKGSDSIIDHCSFGWADDEQWGLYSNNVNYTIQYSVIGPANAFSYHKKGVHGFGIMLGKGNVTLDHNLIPHNVERNFRGKLPGTNVCDFTNNVIYDWGSKATAGSIGHTNYVGNTLKAGNSTYDYAPYKYNYIAIGENTTNAKDIMVYLDGNRMLDKYGNDVNGYSYNNWNGIAFTADSGKNIANTKSDTPFEMTVDGVNVSSVQGVEPSAAAYENVLTYAGCGVTSEKRLAIDRQSADETRNGTGYISGIRPYSEATGDIKKSVDKYKIKCGVVYEYPDPILQNDIIDTDRDGMPDDWEAARGLDPNDPKDATGDYLGEGYNNIEYYINDLTVDAFPKGVVTISPTLDELNR